MKTFKDVVNESTQIDEGVQNLDQLYSELRSLPKPSWNSFMADISNSLPKPIPTSTLNASLSKLVRRKP